MDIQEIVETVKKEFFWMHRHPELSGKEFRTTARVKDFLKSHGITTVDLPLRTGAVAYITTNRKGPVIALRCDMDALPIQEKTDLSYQSEFPGIMHACGHDFHTATLLGVALMLHEGAEKFSGSVKLIFQPAEETAEGAKAILDTGVLEDVDVIFTCL